MLPTVCRRRAATVGSFSWAWPSAAAASAQPTLADESLPCTRHLSPQACLDTLLSTTFINTIDAPSLALVVPVVRAGPLVVPEG